MLYAQVHLTLPAWVHELAPAGTVYETDEDKMRLAVELSRINVDRRSGGPFGAAVFDAQQRLIAVGVNRVEPHTCSVAHAEMMAYMTAQQRLQRFRINEDAPGVTLATSSQPCCMCYGATFWAGIDTLLIGARSEDVMTLTQFDEGPLPVDWKGELEQRGIAVRRDLLREEACAVLSHYTANAGRMY
ncbi:MAG: nucleoside deaminase [Aquimonas sp.]|nr:nucleoside deaminase [Aquimonas sp.]